MPLETAGQRPPGRSWPQLFLCGRGPLAPRAGAPGRTRSRCAVSGASRALKPAGCGRLAASWRARGETTKVAPCGSLAGQRKTCSLE